MIERFSRIHPATPFVFWLPVLAFLAFRALFTLHVGAVAFVGLVVAGVLLWTLTEYTLHRYLFHYVGPRPWQRRLHFILHGVHHDFPQDVGRLVMPLGVSIPIGVGFYVLFPACARSRRRRCAVRGLRPRVPRVRRDPLRRSPRRKMTSRLGQAAEAPPHDPPPHRGKRPLGSLVAPVGLGVRDVRARRGTETSVATEPDGETCPPPTRYATGLKPP